MWRISGFLVLLTLAEPMSAMSQTPPAQQRWAALNPNTESSAPVVWAATQAEAIKRAIDACKRVSRNCADKPASTDDLDDIFAVMCCSQPRVGCATSAAESRQAGRKSLEKTFADAGYSQCATRHYISAKTGKKL